MAVALAVRDMKSSLFAHLFDSLAVCGLVVFRLCFFCAFRGVIVCLVGWLVRVLVGWLVAWPVGRSAGGVVCWLVCWLGCWLAVGGLLVGRWRVVRYSLAGRWLVVCWLLVGCSLVVGWLLVDRVSGVVVGVPLVGGPLPLVVSWPAPMVWCWLVLGGLSDGCWAVCWWLVGRFVS